MRRGGARPRPEAASRAPEPARETGTEASLPRTKKKGKNDAARGASERAREMRRNLGRAGPPDPRTHEMNPTRGEWRLGYRKHKTCGGLRRDGWLRRRLASRGGGGGGWGGARGVGVGGERGGTHARRARAERSAREKSSSPGTRAGPVGLAGSAPGRRPRLRALLARSARSAPAARAARWTPRRRAREGLRETFALSDEDHTLGNALRHVLNRHLRCT